MAFGYSTNCKGNGLKIKYTRYTSYEIERIKKAAKSFEISMPHKKLYEICDKLYIFNAIDKDDVIKITKNVKFKRYKKGDVIIHELENSKEIYFILYGSCAIVSKGKVVATLKSGYMFGEIAFLTGNLRSATVIVHKEGTTLLSFEIDEEKMTQRYAFAFAILYRNIALDLAEKLRKSNLKNNFR